MRANVTTSTCRAPPCRSAVAAARSRRSCRRRRPGARSGGTRRPRRRRRARFGGDLLSRDELAHRRRVAGPDEQPCRGEAPAGRELSGESLGRVVAPDEEPRRIGRDIGDDVGRGSLEALDRELSGQSRCAAEPVLLPRGHQIACRTRVRDCCAGPTKGEAAPGALAASLYRPKRRGAAAPTHHRAQNPERLPADAAEHARRRGTGDATRRKTRSMSHALDGTREPVACLSRLRAECVTPSQEGSYAARVGSPASTRRRLSASSNCFWSPMSYQGSAKTQPYTGSR